MEHCDGPEIFLKKPPDRSPSADLVKAANHKKKDIDSGDRVPQHELEVETFGETGNPSPSPSKVITEKVMFYEQVLRREIQNPTSSKTSWRSSEKITYEGVRDLEKKFNDNRSNSQRLPSPIAPGLEITNQDGTNEKNTQREVSPYTTLYRITKSVSAAATHDNSGNQSTASPISNSSRKAKYDFLGVDDPIIRSRTPSGGTNTSSRSVDTFSSTSFAFSNKQGSVSPINPEFHDSSNKAAKYSMVEDDRNSAVSPVSSGFSESSVSHIVPQTAQCQIIGFNDKFIAPKNIKSSHVNPSLLSSQIASSSDSGERWLEIQSVPEWYADSGYRYKNVSGWQKDENEVQQTSANNRTSMFDSHIAEIRGKKNIPYFIFIYFAWILFIGTC